jgi:hypothetical protein
MCFKFQLTTKSTPATLAAAMGGDHGSRVGTLGTACDILKLIRDLEIGYNQGIMAHPNGGAGNTFETLHTFTEAYNYVGKHGIRLRSTTGEKLTITRGVARDEETPTIVFVGERNRHGSACRACWGFRLDCNGARIGQCAEPLDENVH